MRHYANRESPRCFLGKRKSSFGSGLVACVNITHYTIYLPNCLERSPVPLHIIGGLPVEIVSVVYRVRKSTNWKREGGSIRGLHCSRKTIDATLSPYCWPIVGLHHTFPLISGHHSICSLVLSWMLKYFMLSCSLLLSRALDKWWTHWNLFLSPSSPSPLHDKV